MFDQPPPYKEETSSIPAENRAMSSCRNTDRGAALQEKHLLFAKTTHKVHRGIVQSAKIYMAKEGWACKKDELFAYQEMMHDVNMHLVEIVSITCDNNTTFRGLIEEIMPQIVSKPDVWKAVENGWRVSAVQVCQISVLWNGVESRAT